MRWPFGDQFGCTPSLWRRILRVPVAASTTQSSLIVPRDVGVKVTLSVAQTICLPSGDHAGLKQLGAMRRADSPVAPITNTPPPSHSDRYAICEPSGEKAGCESPAVQRFVRLIAFRPSTRCR